MKRNGFVIHASYDFKRYIRKNKRFVVMLAALVVGMCLGALFIRWQGTGHAAQINQLFAGYVAQRSSHNFFQTLLFSFTSAFWFILLAFLSGMFVFWCAGRRVPCNVQGAGIRVVQRLPLRCPRLAGGIFFRSDTRAQRPDFFTGSARGLQGGLRFFRQAVRRLSGNADTLAAARGASPLRHAVWLGALLGFDFRAG